MAKIRALLANGPGQPAGDTECGLELSACLTAQGQIDVPAYLADPLPWRARRYWKGREDWWGELIRVDEAGWALRSQGGEDEPLWTLALSVLRPGEYVSLRRPNGEELVFRIVQVEQD